MMKFTHISNYSDLMGFTIFKCGSGYQQKSQMASTVVWDSCFWYAAAVQEPGLVPQQTGDQRQIQSIRLGQMAQSPSDKCVGIVA